MFVNYVDSDSRSSPVNLAVARLVLGFWLVWKTIWYDWSQYVEMPYRLMVGENFAWAIPYGAPWLLSVEKWLLIGLTCLFVLGYRIRITALSSSFLLAHLGTVRGTLTSSGETSSLFIGSFFLLFFALYAETDELSIDGIRRTRRQSVASLTDRLTASTGHQFRMPAMKYSLLALSILFFSTGVSKVLDGNGLGFVAPDNLARLVLVRSYVYPWYDVQLLVPEYPVVGVLGGLGTLVLELGFLVAVLVGIGLTPVVVGLILFTLSNVFLLGIFFVDNLFFLGVFVAFDRGYARIVRDREITLVFDGDCRTCVRLLYPFKLLDVNGTVTFHTRSTLPDQYAERENGQFGRAIYVFDGEEVYEGYDAVRRLLEQYRVFFVPVWLMGFTPIRTVGQRIYRSLADTHVGGSVDSDPIN